MTAADTTARTWHAAQLAEREFWSGAFRRLGVAALNETRGHEYAAAHLAAFRPWRGWGGACVAVEFGPGPAGLLPFLVAERRYAVEPLADWFQAEGVNYKAMGYAGVGNGTLEAAAAALAALDIAADAPDLLVCCNVLDHTGDLAASLDGLAALGHAGTRLFLCYDLRHTGSRVHPTCVDDATVAERLTLGGWLLVGGETVPAAHDFERISGRRYEVWTRKGAGMNLAVYEGMTRAKWICWWVAKQRQRMGGKAGIMRCLEVGRLRDPKETTGHSTLHIVANGGVRELVTVDANPDTRAATLAVVPEGLHSKLAFVDADAVDWLANAVAEGVEPFDFIYLDGPNEAEACLAIFQLAYGLSKPGTLIMMDDTAETNKGVLSLPWINARPDLFKVEHVIPKDKTCHGMTVVQVVRA